MAAKAIPFWCSEWHIGEVVVVFIGDFLASKAIPVGIRTTLVVGGELNQLKSGGSHSPLGLVFGVYEYFLWVCTRLGRLS